MNKLIACFFRILAIVGSVPIPIFTAEFMWHGMDWRSGWAWWIYLWAFVATTLGSIVVAWFIACGIRPREEKPEPPTVYPEPKTPKETLMQTMLRQQEHLASIVRRMP